MCVDSSRQYSVYERVYVCDYMPSPWTMNTNTHYLAEVEVSHMQVKLKSLFSPCRQVATVWLRSSKTHEIVMIYPSFHILVI